MISTYGDLERPPLNADLLRRALIRPDSMWTRLDVVPTAGSTNAVLIERAGQSPASGIVLIAEHQTAGRGRLDRVWTTPARSAITMSVLVRPPGIEVTRWPWIPLLAGLAVAAAVRSAAEIPAALKWPNDVVVANRKLAGLLVERVESTGLPPAAVIGIGLNVSLRADELPTQTATSLAVQQAATTDRSLLIRAILRNLDGLLRDWMRHRGDAAAGLHAAYVQACATVGQRVRVELSDGRSPEGDAVGVDASGRLLVRTATGQEAFGAGDVVHLRT